MSEKIINIHGVEVDRKTHPFDVSMRETIPTFIVEEIDTLLPFLNEYYSDGFLIYIHKTDVSRVGDSILRDGLLIHEEGGGLETTMSKVYDSKSKYEGGDKNYLFNCINKPKTFLKMLTNRKIRFMLHTLRQSESHSNSIVGVRFFYFCIKGVAGFVVKNKSL